MSHSLLLYLQNNYSKCHREPSFLASWQGLAYTSHSIQAVGMPVEVLTAYLIIRKSPKSMRFIRGALLNSHVWCSLGDLGMSVLLTPYYFVPAMAGFHVGLLSLFHVPAIIQLSLLAFVMFGMIISMIYLFESQSSSIPENRFRIERQSSRALYYLVIYLSTSLMVLLLLKVPEDQEAAKLEVLKLIPCPIEEFFTVPAFVFLTDPFWIHAVTFYIVPAVYTNIILNAFFHSACCVFYLYLSPSIITSSHTRALQRHFFIAITIQATVPFAVMIVPLLTGTGALLMGRFTQEHMTILTVVLGSHGIVESITIILLHKAYREWVIGVFKRQSK